MIFVTVGTEKFPFDRLLKTVDEAKQRAMIKDEIFMQTGNSAYTPLACRFERFLSFHQMLNSIQGADVVVCHAGIGSTLLSLHSRKIPIIFPRSETFGEHLDNHQWDFAQHLKRLSTALVCLQQEDLIDMIVNYKDYALQLSEGTPKDERARLINYLRLNFERTRANGIAA
jgi:UDP-N-acetylglucosamine transferase subunit ALG13